MGTAAWTEHLAAELGAGHVIPPKGQHHLLIEGIAVLGFFRLLLDRGGLRCLPTLLPGLGTVVQNQPAGSVTTTRVRPLLSSMVMTRSTWSEVSSSSSIRAEAITAAWLFSESRLEPNSRSWEASTG